MAAQELAAMPIMRMFVAFLPCVPFCVCLPCLACSVALIIQVSDCEQSHIVQAFCLHPVTDVNYGYYRHELSDMFCRRFFDPEHWKIVLVDQRGCGASRPLAGLQDNNTQALIQDYEQLRKYLKIRKWMLFGGSWGVTLSLAYAQQQPKM